MNLLKAIKNNYKNYKIKILLFKKTKNKLIYFR
jgi:hypothetical protein